jgi:hypothetical protein
MMETFRRSISHNLLFPFDDLGWISKNPYCKRSQKKDSSIVKLDIKSGSVMNYPSIAKELITYLGGKSNITALAHWRTARRVCVWL